MIDELSGLSPEMLDLAEKMLQPDHKREEEPEGGALSPQDIEAQVGTQAFEKAPAPLDKKFDGPRPPSKSSMLYHSRSKNLNACP